MRQGNRERRETEILGVAFRLLEEKGAAGMSMLAVAKAAKASNETLYNWYGDKAGLLRAMAERNGADLIAHLERALPQDASPLETLDRLGPILLELFTDSRAIALARAAAADPMGQLGAVLSEAGPDRVRRRIVALCQRALDDRVLKGGDAETICDTYFALLLADLQIRRAIGATPPMTEAAARARADRALMLTWRLFSRPES